MFALNVSLCITSGSIHIPSELGCVARRALEPRLVGTFDGVFGSQFHLNIDIYLSVDVPS